MSDDFNAYHKWLGIAPTEQPPNHYRLLGVNIFEADADVIASAADRQMSHLRSFQNGPRAKDCQQLLNEVANARLVLLDPNKKADYDQSLQAAVAPAPPIPGPPTAPLAAADIMPPEPEATATAPTLLTPSQPTANTSPVVVAKPSKRRPKKAVGIVPMIAGGVIGFVVLIALFIAIRSAPSTPDSPPTSTTEVAAQPRVEPKEPKANLQESSRSSEANVDPTTPDVAPSDPTQPLNAIVDAQDEYRCTSGSQPQLRIDSSFDSTKSWRLSLVIEASSTSKGTLMCWGDSRAGQDSLCVQTEGGKLSGWVADNSQLDGGSALPTLSVEWPGQHEIEIIYDANEMLVQMRVDEDRRNAEVTHPPKADRPMPLHLGGIGMGASQSFPCTIRNIRLEQLVDPFELQSPTEPMTSAEPAVATTNEPPESPSETTPTPGSLGDLVNKPISKLPAPVGTELQAARTQVQTLFATELNKERTPQESAALADKLVSQANQPGTAPEIQFALFETAIEIASKAGAVPNAAAAITALDDTFEVDIVQRRADAAQTISKVANESWEHRAVVELLEVVIDQCITDDRYDLGMSLVESAQVAARKTKDSATTGRIADRLKEIRSLKVKYEPVKTTLELLVDEPDNADANQRVGTHLCLVKGRWQQGLPYLVKGPASDLRTVASKDIRTPTNATTQATIGHEWQAVASRLDRPLRLRALERAEYWLRLAAEQESGLKRVPLESKIDEIGKQIGELATLPNGAVLVMTFEPSTLKKRGYVMDVSQHGHVGAVSGAVLTEGIAGNALGFDGKDDFVEVASTPWLASPPAFSMSAWVNVLKWRNPAGSIDYVISNEGKGERGFVFRYRGDGTPDLTLGTRAWRSALSQKKAVLGQWHHITGTFDGQTAKVYLDGEFNGDVPIPFPITASNIPVRIGQNAYRKDRGVNGRIDEVAIFNRALSPEEVRTVFRIGQAGRPLMD